jgi:hypothetical protein
MTILAIILLAVLGATLTVAVVAAAFADRDAPAVRLHRFGDLLVDLARGRREPAPSMALRSTSRPDDDRPTRGTRPNADVFYLWGCSVHCGHDGSPQR